MNKFSPNMFTAQLAKYYDMMHQHRDYAKECKFIDDLIKRKVPEAKRVLDICCGTGEHAVRMARLGYEVTGVDQSQDMLDIAVDKAHSCGRSVDFICSDVFQLGMKKKFDVAYCLGYTFLYMTKYSDVRKFFKGINSILLPGSLFLVDFVNGLSLIKDFNKDKFIYHYENATIIRHDRWALDKRRRVKHLDFVYEITDDGGVQKIYAAEDLRIFYNVEVQTLLSGCGFSSIESFDDYVLDLNRIDDPYIVIVSRRKE